ncbi:hypothetical protein [Acinetobacter chinensis]|uniref:hypothetical protein n=1 Tax=Acinetobacter chinensis TaxID=2004650 RepID=UPI002934E335|nr:hypothetical protein [Acinetobacter chinensis]WOE40091.1 hypothetical protein QSG87_09210 [Acinetobacter chinensis]
MSQMTLKKMREILDNPSVRKEIKVQTQKMWDDWHQQADINKSEADESFVEFIDVKHNGSERGSNS